MHRCKLHKSSRLEHFNYSWLRCIIIAMKPTSIDLRKRIVTARLKDSQSMRQIAERFGIAKGTVQNIIERYRDAGTVNPKPANAGRKAAFRGALLKRLERDVLDHPDATLAELRDRSGLAVSLVTVHHTLRRMGFTLNHYRLKAVGLSATESRERSH